MDAIFRKCVPIFLSFLSSLKLHEIILKHNSGTLHQFAGGGRGADITCWSNAYLGALKVNLLW